MNFKLLCLLQKERNKGMVHSLLDIGSCNLHSITIGYKTGTELTEWNLTDVLKRIFTLLRDTPEL